MSTPRKAFISQSNGKYNYWSKKRDSSHLFLSSAKWVSQVISRKTSTKMNSKLNWEKVVVLKVNFYAVSINLTKLTLLQKKYYHHPLNSFLHPANFNGKKKTLLHSKSVYWAPINLQTQFRELGIYQETNTPTLVDRYQQRYI